MLHYIQEAKAATLDGKLISIQLYRQSNEYYENQLVYSTIIIREQ